MCVGCREMKVKRELIRVVRSPDGVLTVDTTGKQPGRGAYICPNIECFDLAIKSKGIQRALELELPDEVRDNIQKQIESMGSS